MFHFNFRHHSTETIIDGGGKKLFLMESKHKCKSLFGKFGKRGHHLNWRNNRATMESNNNLTPLLCIKIPPLQCCLIQATPSFSLPSS